MWGNSRLGVGLLLVAVDPAAAVTGPHVFAVRGPTVLQFGFGSITLDWRLKCKNDVIT